MANLFNEDYLQHLSKKYRLNPSKEYGQNYLIDREVIEKIVTAGEVKSNDVIVEVGPGFGVLTLPLSEKAGKVVSFEIERKLMDYWMKLLENHSKIEIVWGNVLREFGSFNAPAEGYKVIANLPYQITSPAVRLFLEEAKVKPTEMILMVQKEVAERICAKPGDMSVLALSVQYYGEPEYLSTVPRTSFWPSPKVDSAIIKIKVRSAKVGRDEVAVEKEIKNFFRWVKIGFANKRKLLTKNLEPMVGKENREKLKEVFEKIGLTKSARAQELSLEQWQRLIQEMVNFDSTRPII